MKKKREFFDFLIIGSGIAGLISAIKLSRIGTVLVITKRGASDTNTSKAQGGIACVMDNKDSYKDHIEDTLNTGAKLCNRKIVEKIVKAGPKALEELISYGTYFTTRGEMGDLKHKNEFHLGKEGGHHKRRVLHSGDITGEEIQKVLLNRCNRIDNIKIYENHIAIDLISSWRLGWLGDNHCLGAYILDIENNQIKTVLSYATILATGGAGKAYLYTSNPDIACGDGIAMAYRAYAKIANMEFYQFHPTILYHPQKRSFLISEALRGEGGTLKIENSKGKLVEFMKKYHPMGSLAPRDIVARAIDNEMKKSGQEFVCLDITSQDREFLKKRFPNIYNQCFKCGIDIAVDPIPVVPAAHYSCGGVKTDERGDTGIIGLYAVGECACTGFHGANRLASNSLLEAATIPTFIAEDIELRFKRLKKRRPTGNIPDWTTGDATGSDELIVITHNWKEIRHFMWDYVGIVRTNKRLERAKRRIENIKMEIDKYYWDFYITPEIIELRNIATVAELIIKSALLRKESRGVHYNADYPDRNPAIDYIDTIITRKNKTDY